MDNEQLYRTCLSAYAMAYSTNQGPKDSNEKLRIKGIGGVEGEGIEGIGDEEVEVFRKNSAHGGGEAMYSIELILALI